MTAFHLVMHNSVLNYYISQNWDPVDDVLDYILEVSGSYVDGTCTSDLYAF